LGPGNRIGIWLCGCTRGCKGCSNPELWEPRSEFEITVDDVFSLVQRVSATHPVDGFTISGGEPMDQADDLAVLLGKLAGISDDLLIYSGYQIEELRDRKDSATDRILQTASVLIDGSYIEEQNHNTILRGSSNQRVHILNKKYEEQYQRYLAEAHNQIQNFTTADGVVSVGIHHPTF
jgi:anaerobic ribonucleoside-triphosphate reductase activating protein